METLPVIRGPPATSLLWSSPLSLVLRLCHFTKLSATHSGGNKCLQVTKCTQPLVMPEVAHFASTKPLLPTVTPQPSFSASPLTLSVLTTTTQLPRDEFHMQVHTILIVVIFCVVCLLLLLAFLYAFCLHCSIGSSPKDSNRANGCSLEREDATYKCSSSDNQPVGNIV